MNRKHSLYCRLCWQEFDSISQHDAPSAYDRQRLNGHCRGDIQALSFEPGHSTKRPLMPFLDLDCGVPLEVK